MTNKLFKDISGSTIQVPVNPSVAADTQRGKIIVCVSASYCKKDELMRILKKYSQYSDESFAYWDEFAFTSEILPECDALLVFNTPGNNIRSLCFTEKVISFMMEPGIKNLHPWMFAHLEQYRKVYSPINQSKNTEISHGFLGWYFKYDYTYLKNLLIPEKAKMVSCIASDLKELKGQRLRLNFIKISRQQFPQIDFFGKGNHFLPDKMDGLLPYRYSIAIENSSLPHYFTEKINDCFLAYTVPVYYGCKNIGAYFPERSFIQIDIENAKEAIRKIEFILTSDDWKSRLEALKEARELVLNKYQPLAGAANIFRRVQPTAEKKEIILEPVRLGLLQRIKNTFNKLVKS